MATMDLASILGEISSYVSGVSGQKQEAQARVVESDNLRKQGVEAVQQIGDLSQQANAIDMQQQLEQEKRKKATAAAFGTDILDPENRIAYLAREQAAAVDESLARSKRAQDLLDTNIFDDPLSYMVQRPFAFRDAQAAAGASQRAKVAGDAINELNRQTQATVQTQAAINEELTNAEVEIRAKVQQVTASQAVQAAQLKRNDAFMQDITQLRSLDKDMLTARVQAYQLVQHEREFATRMEEVRANREARAKTKKSEEEDLQYQFQRYNMGADMTGNAKAMSLADFQSMIKLNKQQVQKLVSVGETVWIDPKSSEPQYRSAQIAPTPGEAFRTLAEVKGTIPQSAEKMGAMYQNEYAKAVDTLKARGGKVTHDDIVNQINKQINGYTEKSEDGKKSKDKVGSVQEMLGNVERDAPGGYTNIYKAPSTEVLVQRVPALAEVPGFADIIRPAILASGPSPTVDSVMNQAKLSIREGKVTVQEAAALVATYFTTAVDVNIGNEGYQKYGLPMYAKGKDSKITYSAPVTTASLVGSTKKSINATNVTEVERHLLSDVVDLNLLQKHWKGY
jgi:hypothetical protein